MFEKLFRIGTLVLSLLLLAIASEPALSASVAWSDSAKIDLLGGAPVWLRDLMAHPAPLLLAAGMCIGAWMSWLLSHVSRPRRLSAETVAILADEMRTALGRMRRISEACHRSEYEPSAMVLLFNDFQALQLSLRRAGLRAPWKHWEPGEDPLPYLTANMGYLTFIEPLLRKGHMTTAIRTTHKFFTFEEGARGPLIRMGNALKRIA